jgi:hypothetical protein
VGKEVDYLILLNFIGNRKNGQDGQDFQDKNQNNPVNLVNPVKKLIVLG